MSSTAAPAAIGIHQEDSPGTELGDALGDGVDGADELGEGDALEATTLGVGVPPPTATPPEGQAMTA